MYCILGICLIADCYVVMGYLRYVSYPDKPRNSYYMTYYPQMPIGKKMILSSMYTYVTSLFSLGGMTLGVLVSLVWDDVPICIRGDGG